MAASSAESTVTSARKQAGNLIRQARVDANLTQVVLAKELNCSQPKINKIETGKSRIKQADLEKVIAVCQVDERTARELRELVTNDQQGKMRSGQRPLRTDAGSLELVPEYFREFTDLEPTAWKVRAWHGERLPGLLQSEQYMLNLFKSNNRSDTVTQLMINRNKRKKVLRQESPPLFHYLLGEGALRRMPGGQDSLILLDQVEYLIQLMETFEDQLAISLVPFNARLAYVPNDFTIMEFVDGTTNFVYVEYPGGGQHLEDPGIYRACDRQLDELRGAALQRQETKAWFLDLAERCRRHRKSNGGPGVADLFR
jgi:transcriptional regulator with XRE-family HTH domain